MSKQSDLIREACKKKICRLEYQFVHYKQFDYSCLKDIYYIITAGQGERISYNDVIIMADTETSKKKEDIRVYEKGKYIYKTGENHVVAWTISIRAFHHNIVTLWGHKPSKLIETITRIHEHMSGLRTVIYWHNFSYDHIFIRKFAYNYWGTPKEQLNVKSHYPILMEFENGIIFKDSLILAQRNLQKWADDLETEHRKAKGKWDYDLIRDQSTKLSQDELEYIEHDTLAGVECLDKTMQALNKKLYSMPLTATGVPREQTRKRGKKKAHEEFLKMAFSLEQYLKATMVYHGGFTHGNRHYIDFLISKETWKKDIIVKCYDFASSYPYAMIAYKFPMEKFTRTDNCSADFILENAENYAYMFRFTAVNIKLKSDEQPMPALQFSKCDKTINAITDNGRVLAANFISINLTEYDLMVIKEQYTWDKHLCSEVEFATKDYLPRWFTDYVFECFTNKTMLKGGDPVAYSIAKAIVNSLYGMCVQHSLKDDIKEDYDTGEFNIVPPADPEEEYQKYRDKITSILPYQWGVWVTAIAFYNVHQLAKCCRLPLYMDTDSCYGLDWDTDKLNAYNYGCKERIRANGYGPVVRDGREYWLGVAESEGEKDEYTEFKYMGAKRYCGRCKANGELKITVAGVPKKPGAKSLKDDISNFHPGFIFSGTDTGKKTHVYFTVDDIYIDERGNETGDSISLIPCDYELDSVNVVDWESLFNEDVKVQIYDEY